MIVSPTDASRPGWFETAQPKYHLPLWDQYALATNLLMAVLLLGYGLIGIEKPKYIEFSRDTHQGDASTAVAQLCWADLHPPLLATSKDREGTDGLCYAWRSQRGRFRFRSP